MIRFVCALMMVAAVNAANMPQLYAKYSMFGKPNEDSFFTVPRTEEQALAKNWIIPEETRGNGDFYKTYCNPQDLRICILIDNKQSICGYQISIPAEVDSLNIPRFNYTDKGFKKGPLFGEEMYYNQMFFASQETIENGGREFDGQTGDSLHLQVKDELLEIPLQQSQMNTTKFTEQNCFVRMGKHYFWDVRDQLQPEEFMPWFVLFDDNGDLIGFGFLAFGSLGQFEKAPYIGALAANSWLENVPSAAIKMIAPGVPKWVLDYVDTYGLYSHHMYFSDEPWNIVCKNNILAGKKY